MSSDTWKDIEIDRYKPFIFKSPFLYLPESKVWCTSYLEMYIRLKPGAESKVAHWGIFESAGTEEALEQILRDYCELLMISVKGMLEEIT